MIHGSDAKTPHSVILFPAPFFLFLFCFSFDFESTDEPRSLCHYPSPYTRVGRHSSQYCTFIMGHYGAAVQVHATAVGNPSLPEPTSNEISVLVTGFGVSDLRPDR